MVTKIPTPYFLDVEGEVPNIYMIGLGAGYIATIAGDTLVRDSNAFQSYITQFSNKTAIDFNKGLFGQDIFRRVFVITLSNMYSAYSSARSQYLYNQKLPEELMPVATTTDDVYLMLEFMANKASDLDEVLKNNKDINKALKAFVKKYGAYLLDQLKNTTNPSNSQQQTNNNINDQQQGP